jgi:hypothetical protein
MATKGNQGSSSNKLVRPGVRGGVKADAVNPKYPPQIGSALGDHVTHGRKEPLPHGKIIEKRREPGPSPISVPMGNTLAAATVCGPGGSRTVMKSGSQQQYGTNPGNPTPVPDRGRPETLINEFGRSMPGAQGRFK